jgi:hypothetical protein
MENRYPHPEPVPPASQLSALPFLAAVDGALQAGGKVAALKTTIHRTMTREGRSYLQQVCGYLPPVENWHSKAGRFISVDTGIVGAAYESGSVWRTRSYEDEEKLLADLRLDMADTNDDRAINTVGLSYLAIPFLGPDNTPVLVLYSECRQLNFFADDPRVKLVEDMCAGFATLLDRLQKEPFPNLRNFPLEKGIPVKEGRTLYPRLQEKLGLPVPRLTEIASFNFEAAVA